MYWPGHLANRSSNKPTKHLFPRHTLITGNYLANHQNRRLKITEEKAFHVENGIGAEMALTNPEVAQSVWIMDIFGLLITSEMEHSSYGIG